MALGTEIYNRYMNAARQQQGVSELDKFRQQMRAEALLRKQEHNEASNRYWNSFSPQPVKPPPPTLLEKLQEATDTWLEDSKHLLDEVK